MEHHVALRAQSFAAAVAAEEILRGRTAVIVVRRGHWQFAAANVQHERDIGVLQARPNGVEVRMGTPADALTRAVTGIARLRAKLKYRPVVFELLPAEFTLTELQRTVEAISGRHLHKQNFRRLVEAGALVEPTGEMSTQTGGRPAALFRFRREVLQERPAPGLRVRGRR